MKISFLCVFLLSVFVNSIDSYRILCLFPFNGRSHHIMFDALCKGLARRGHQIHMISHFPTKNPPENFKDIVNLNGTMKSVVNSFTVDFAKDFNNGAMYRIANRFGYDICKLMGVEQFQEFIKNAPNDPPYDIILVEYFGSPCYLGFGPYLNAPLALALSSVEMPYIDEFIGNPLNNAIFPGIFTDTASLSSFTDRLSNTLTNFIQTRLFFHYTSIQTEIMRKYLGPEIPDVRELERTVSLVVVNSHHSFHGVRSVTSALVQVGGLHIAADETQFPQDLKKWMDSAKDGVVYFTLGSLINIETMEQERIRDLYSSFGKIAPVKVLMKCADKTKLPPGIPSNILTSPWIPQIPVLSHKNTKVFITHGGLMGSLESLHYGVPMIGIPLFADQIRNVNIFVEKGMAVSLNLDNITEVSMDEALNAVLKDPSYMATAKRESVLFRDRPMNQLDTAIYWIEYVIRNGPDSLKSPAVELNWWQLHLVDVYAFLIGCLALVLYLLTVTVKLLLKSKSPRKLKGTEAHKKKKHN